MKNLTDVFYLDNHASTMCDPRIVDFYQKLMLDSSFANPHSSEHAWGWKAEEIVSNASDIISSHFNALPDEVIFTSGATEANNLAIMGLAQTNHFEKHGRKKIIVSAIEHKCVLNASLYAAKLYDLDLVICPINTDGIVDLSFLKDNIDSNTLLVSVMAVNNEIGTVQPLQEIGALTKQFEVPFHVDAAQAAYEEIDMVKLGIDLLSASGHKIYAPKGIGCLIISSDAPISVSPILHGGGQQNGLRAGTLSPELCASFAKAYEILVSEGEEEAFNLKLQRDSFLKELDRLGVNYVVNGDLNKRHPGNLNLSFKDTEASVLINNLQPKMAVSTGSACNSGVIETSYVLEALGYDDNRISSSVRFGFGRFNLHERPKDYASIIRDALDELRSKDHIPGAKIKVDQI